MSNIIIKDLRFSYRPQEEVLKGINLVFEHTATAILGQNGAGKTTLVKLLKGLLRPNSGVIYVNNHNICEISVARLAKTVGLVFQNPNDQIFKSTVVDEVMFGPLNIGQSVARALENSLKALELVGLLGHRRTHPYDLSLSQRKLVSIAAVIAMEPEIVIFDEPTIAQDYHGRERIKGIINDLKTQGKLVLTISHDLDFVAETFERTILLHEGQVIMDGATRRVFSFGELLNWAGLGLPHVTELGRALGCTQTFLTPEEFIGKFGDGF
ncbi:MAG TPA: ABC transporter ATP-binding protein [Bacillota bacterium]